MRKDESEMHLMENVNYSQTPTTQQNIVYPTTQMPVPNDGSIESRLMNTKIVRLRISERCECNCNRCKALFYTVNTVSRIDDLNRKNENEIPLFEVEDTISKCCCLDLGVKYNLLDPKTRTLFGTCESNGFPLKEKQDCSGDYIKYPPLDIKKVYGPIDTSHVNQYDSRSFYRTYEYLGTSQYQIGKKFIEPDFNCYDFCCQCCNCFNCCDCRNRQLSCCNCSTPETNKRIYADILNMSEQKVGKLVHFYDINCCNNITEEFFEIYFPADANLMLRLAFIGQMLYSWDYGLFPFGIVPGTMDDLEQFIA